MMNPNDPHEHRFIKVHCLDCGARLAVVPEAKLEAAEQSLLTLQAQLEQCDANWNLKYDSVVESLSTMRAALLQLEWMNKTATEDLCPWCDEAKTDGHDPDCIIAAALSTQQAGETGDG